MASISKRSSKSGMTYRIQVKIKDKGSGEIKVHSTTWKPPVGLTPKQMEREVVIYASEYENAIKALETASGEPSQSAETTFSGYALWWLKRRKNEVAASYFVNCESAIELTNKHIGGYKLKELTPNIIQQYYDKLDRMEKTVTVVTAKPALRERMNQTGIGYMKLRYEKNFSSCSLSNALAGKQISYEYAKRLAETLGEKTDNLFNVTHTTQKYAYETISKIKRTIRAVLATAKKQRLIADNYASADYITFPKRPPRDIDYMDDEDAKKFYKAADEFPDIRYKTAMLTLLLTGMRRGELCGLEWSDIDFDNATITIARSLTAVRKVGLVLKDPKTESSKRVIAISDKLISVLTEYKDWYEEYREMHGDKWENSNRLFIGEYGGNIYPGTINMWMKRICQTAGLEERTVHSLRHMNITMQIAAGVPIVTVAGRAGHARTSTTTDIYSHFLKTADRSAAQKLEEIFD